MLQEQRTGAACTRSSATRISNSSRRCGLSLSPFRLLRPRSTEEAIAFLAAHTGKLRVLAGGTDLIPSMRQKLFEPEFVLDLRGIGTLRGIKPHAAGGVEIGALTSLRELERSDFLHQHYPVLTEAAATVASPVL